MDWLQIVKVTASIGLVSWVSYREINYFLNRKRNAWVNKDFGKGNNSLIKMFRLLMILQLNFLIIYYFKREKQNCRHHI